MFDFEKAIREWKRGLRKIESFEDGMIAELESHLRDEIDRQKARGRSDEDAFLTAAGLVGSVPSIADEYRKTNARALAGPPSWKTQGFSPALLANYLKTAVRKARRQKVHALINLAGLTLGLTCCLLLVLWVQDELSFDRFHENAGRIYRVENITVAEGKEDRLATDAAPLAQALTAEFPAIEKAVRFGDNEFMVVRAGRRFREKVFFADPTVFDVFTLPLVKGDPKSALNDRDSLLLSEAMARKYFGRDDPVGKILTFDDYGDFRITGVFKDIPGNSHLRFGFLGQFVRYAGRSLNKWGMWNYYIYILAGPGFRPEFFDAEQPAFVKKYQGAMIRPGVDVRYVLQPLTRIHLHSRARNEIGPNSDMGRIYLFSAVALLVLLIACFNYINFATASYASRTREVGMRKAVGAGQRQIIGQFLGESLLVSSLAMALACVLAGLLLPAFNGLAGKSLMMSALFDGRTIAGLVAFVLLTGLLAGSYPAVFLSAVGPSTAFRGPGVPRLKASGFRNALVVFQFAISIGFIAATLVIAAQMSYIRDKNLGLDKEHVITLPLWTPDILKRIEVFKSELREDPAIVGSSASNFFPGNNPYNQSYWREGLSDSEYPAIRWIAVDHDFLKTMGIPLVAGRDFSRDVPTDTGGAYILNEAAVKDIGLASPLGTQFRINEKGTIIGVVKDFHFESLRDNIVPMALEIEPSLFEYLSVRIRPGRTAHALEFLKQKWERFAPGTTFTYSFLDEDVGRMYESEMRLNKIFLAAAAASLLTAGLGLFGLAALAAKRRTKEIGIRKVLGASVAGITVQISREFLALVALANLIAWPAAYYGMGKWLQGFAYRTDLGLGSFLLATAIALFVAAATVSGQALRVALANPVESLRIE